MILYIQNRFGVIKEGIVNASIDEEKVANRKTQGVYVRLSETEKKKLKKLSQQSGVSVSQLIRTGALEGLETLPRFRKLPAEVLAELAKLEKLTTALWYISQRVSQDELYAKDIQIMVYEAGKITTQINQFCQANLCHSHTVRRLEEFIEKLDSPNHSLITLEEVISQLQSLRESFQTTTKL